MSVDSLSKDLGMAQYAATVVLLVLQATVFVAWWRNDRTFDVNGINIRIAEILYWLTASMTFAFGTAAGDFAAGASA